MKRIFAIVALCTVIFGQDVLSIWDTDSIFDYSWMEVETLWTTDTSFTDILGLDLVNLKVGEIRYTSFGGDSGYIRIQGYFAYPSSGSNLPGFIVNHGIIMDGELEMAMTFASGIRSFVLAISAPGHGTSEGGSAYHLPNLVRSHPDPRNNHFYQFAYATMRGVNYMENLDIVDNDWLGLLGFSGGADACFLANAIDTRIAINVPIIPQTDFRCSAAEDGWMVNVMEVCGYTEDDPNVIALQDWIAPINYAPYQNGYTMMIVAAQDEFEPLRCARNTYEELDPDNSRWEIIGNFDHHCYFTPYGLLFDYDSYDNTSSFYVKILGNVNTLIELRQLGSPIPQNPGIATVDLGDSTEFRVYTGAAFYTSNDVHLWFSIDSAYTFANIPMEQHYALPVSYFRAKLPNAGGYALTNLIYYAEANSLPFFRLSTMPQIPDGIGFKLRPFPYEWFGMGVDEAPLPRGNGLSIYPNPFNSQLHIDAPQHFTVTIHDVQGHKLDHLGGKRIWSPSDDVPSGVYIVRARMGENVVEGKVVLVR